LSGRWAAPQPEEFGKLIASELKLWEKVVKDAGISAQE